MYRMNHLSPIAIVGMLLSLLAVGYGSTLAQDASPSPTASSCPSPLENAVASPHAMQTAPEVATPMSGEPVCVSILVGEFYIKADRTTLRVGETYVFVIGNEGEITHEFVIQPAGATDTSALEAEIDGEEREAELEDIEPGQTVELEWTFTEPGTYQFVCHIPGHFEAGMVLEFEVTE